MELGLVRQVSRTSPGRPDDTKRAMAGVQGGQESGDPTDPQTTVEQHLEVTKLGFAVHKGNIDLDRAPQLYEDLTRAQVRYTDL